MHALKTLKSIILFVCSFRLYNRKKIVFLCLVISAILVTLYHVEGSHQSVSPQHYAYLPM